MENVQENNYMINDLGEKREEFFPGTVVKYYNEGTHYYFKCDNEVLLDMHFISDRIVRFRFGTDGGIPKHFSYAILDEPQQEVEELEFAERDDHYRLTTKRIICTVSKKGLNTRILNKSGEILCEDEKGFHWETNQENGGNFVFSSKKIQGNEHFFGLGDKSCNLDMRGKKLELWGSDTYGYGKKSDPLYKNIPFYIGLHHQKAYGIFFDNTFRTYFDFGAERSNVTSYYAHGGEMDYYFIYGPDAEEVAAQYALLTGTPELPPLWTLGFHQCKWSYYPEKVVREITDGFRERKIPCDAIYLDIDYMDGFRCFTWNQEHFPDHKKMIADFKKQGFKTVVIIDPGIKIDQDYSVYVDGLKKDLFCKRADGPLMKGSVWPGLCVFPDYTKPEARAWWADLFKGLIAEDGIKGIWNDMNEPAVFETGTFPNDVRHDYDGHPCSHRKAHNVYGMQMAKATYQGVKKFSYPDRPFTITRSGYSGLQRYASVWTGDNVASWDHLKIANTQVQRLSTSGISFAGSDIGGFIESPSGELFIRWIQLGIFHPFCRVHSSGDHGDQEPWSFGDEYTDLFRKFVELRYQLLPYIYTTFWQHVAHGTPMIRQIQLLAQDDIETHGRQEEFGFGDHLYVCPVTEKGVDGRWLYLPQGNWYYYWTDEKHEGKDEVWAKADLERVPLFIKEGAIIPFYPVQQYVGEKEISELTLQVYYTEGEETSIIYEDAGDGYDYESGNSNVKTLFLKNSGTEVAITQQVDGKFSPSYESYNLVLHGFDEEYSTLDLDGETIQLTEDKYLESAVKIAVVNSSFKELKILK